MDYRKPKSLVEIEKKLDDLPEGSYRRDVLDAAKNFKKSWIELGQMLFTVYKDKLFKEWGYSEFEIYCHKEIGIKKETSLKLLRSYYFLEKEEPSILKKDTGDESPAQIPSYESVNVLRMAKNSKELEPADYNKLRDSVFEKIKDAKDVRKEFRSMVEALKEKDPVEERQKRRKGYIIRIVGNLKSIKKEAHMAKLLPAAIISDLDKIISRLEEELSQ